MKKISLEHLCDATLSTALDQLAACDRGITAELLAHIAEFERRRLHARAGYPSMHAYCVTRLRMSDDVAFKRIRVARAARRFGGILTAIQEGRLSVSGVMLLAPCLKSLPRREGLELLATAENKPKREIEKLLAERFPQPDLPTFVVPMVPATSEFRQLAPGPVATNGATASSAPVGAEVHAVATSTSSMADRVPVSPAAFPAHARVVALSPGRFAFQMSIGEPLQAKLARLQSLLSHEIPSGNLEQVVERAVDIAIAHVEKRKYGATDKPRSARDGLAGSRHIPAEVRRAVRERDEERCTYVSPDGKRCEATTMLEFDHIVPYAQGGEATTSNIRLRCRTHNQFDAEMLYGTGFMEQKRQRTKRDETEYRRETE